MNARQRRALAREAARCGVTLIPLTGRLSPRWAPAVNGERVRGDGFAPWYWTECAALRSGIWNAKRMGAR